MKRIQTLKDITALTTEGSLPACYIEEIEEQFLQWYETEQNGESIDSFSLGDESCIYHLTEESDMHLIMDRILDVEFIEKERIDGWTYYRVGLMNDHEMNLLYFLEGTLPVKVEQWLSR